MHGLETFCGWFQRFSLETVRALLGIFLFPESLFSCNSESYVREEDKIRILDKNSTKRNVHLPPAFWGHFGVFSGSSSKAVLALSWHLAECHDICNAQAKSHLGWSQPGFTSICGNVHGCASQPSVLFYRAETQVLTVSQHRAVKPSWNLQEAECSLCILLVALSTLHKLP